MPFTQIWNEKPYDVEYVKTLRRILNLRNLEHVTIVAADGGWEITHDLKNDADFFKAVDVIG